MKEKIISSLKEYTVHKHVILTSRGNSAIYIAACLAKKFNPKRYFLVPDQAGWLTYKQFPLKLKFKLDELKTDYGIINLIDLKSKLRDASALIYQNPAGYFAEQPIKEIYRLCSRKCMVIMDVTGLIGTDMCNNKYADIFVCSFGRGKPVNLGYGGFISFNDKRYMDFIENSLSDKRKLFFDNKKALYALLNQLNVLEDKYKRFFRTCEKIKNDLSNFDVIHKDKKGINVVVRYNTEQEKEKIIKYCNINNHEFVLCPRYIRVNEKAVSIEVIRG